MELIFRPRCIVWELQMHLELAPVNLKKRAETVWFSAFLNYPKEIVLKDKSLGKRSRAIIAFFVSMFG